MTSNVISVEQNLSITVFVQHAYYKIVIYSDLLYIIQSYMQCIIHNVSCKIT